MLILLSHDIDPDEVIKSQEELMNEQTQQAIGGMQQGGEGNEVTNAEGVVSHDARNGTPTPNGEDELEITEDFRFSQGRCDILKFIVSLDEILGKVIDSLGTRKDTSNIYK